MNTHRQKWLRKKGYLHITPQIDTDKHRNELLSKLGNPNFIAKYCFYPLIHSSIKERKYKSIPQLSQKRGHSYTSEGKHFRTFKDRPLHYATHMDSLIFGYYAEKLSDAYESKLKSQFAQIDECVIAYRRIPTDVVGKNKGTMHFAKDVFDEIKRRGEAESCSVLMFDIKSFFSRLDHKILKDAWLYMLDQKEFTDDHKNVFNATTKFSYILLDDLRIKQNINGRRAGFDERKLHEIRQEGKFAYFTSPKEFRDKIKRKELKLFRYPFWDKKRKVPVGIPQGLPISAVLANIYLLKFDVDVVSLVVDKLKGFYRRYSDDILIICRPEDVEVIKKFINDSIEKNLVKISPEKTEEYFFKVQHIGKSKKRLISNKIWNENKNFDANDYRRYARCQMGVPLTYLGFEFYGYQTLIKSANLSKFYRRMIKSVKNRAAQAKNLIEKEPDSKLAVFKNQLCKIYTLQDLTKTKVKLTSKKLVRHDTDTYVMKSTVINSPLRSNYMSYVRRVSIIMKEAKIVNQIRKHQEIFKDAIKKHLNK
ncbi:reverse transcriptase domain-containing protein [Chitinophagaceae bacterium 26-R-25]|nr:reverse transcriptase domain-containing protein [Chitinophagaceae bacterium 26-R-25]